MRFDQQTSSANDVQQQCGQYDTSAALKTATASDFDRIHMAVKRLYEKSEACKTQALKQADGYANRSHILLELLKELR